LSLVDESSVIWGVLRIISTTPTNHQKGNIVTTGKKAASDAGKILSNPNSTKKEKEVAASDLAQRRTPPKGKGK
jgi:hypothetical protein